MKITRLLTNTIGTAMLAGALMLAPQAAQARVFLSVGFAPPAIPVYEQPLCPGDGYIWTPGYWQYTDDGYEWVDGAWVIAPYTGALWTPGYWGYADSGYFWNAGYWGPTVGYYGGLNYGFGYFGTGFYGGYWNGGHFFYNREYNHFGAGFRGGDHFYSQHYANFDGRPGGASFARRVNIDNNRGGSFNNPGAHPFNGETNRNGLGQNGDRGQQANQPVRVANGNEGRGFNNGNGGANSFARPVAPVNNFHPSQGSNINGGFGANNNVRPAAPVSNYRPTQSNNFGSFNGGANSFARPVAPTNNYRPAQGSNFGGGPQRSAPAQSFNGGAQRSAPAPSSQGGGGGSFHGGGGGSGFHGGGGRR